MDQVYLYIEYEQCDFKVSKRFLEIGQRGQIVEDVIPGLNFWSH